MLQKEYQQITLKAFILFSIYLKNKQLGRSNHMVVVVFYHIFVQKYIRCVMT